MIKINLLGEQVIDSRSSYGIVVAYVGSVILTVALGAVVSMYYWGESSELKNEAKQLETRLVQLEKITKDVAGLEAKKRDLDDKLSVIARLRLSKQGPVKLFDDLNIAIPEHLWVTELKETKGVLSISGLALSDTAIVEFVKKLEASDFFKTAEIGNATQVYLLRQVTRDSSRGRGRSGAGAVSDNVEHKVVKYEQLSREQREAFAAERFGAGVKLRSFFVRSGITYIGKAALKKVEEERQKLEAGKPAPAGRGKKGKKAPAAKKD